MKAQHKALIILIMGLGLAFTLRKKPTLYIIGDSTVQNTNQVKWGWGTLITGYFDTSKINIVNLAIPGRSTRTFTKEGRWQHVDSLLKPGDYVMMQFGHNDGAIPDTTKAGYRGALRGISEDTVILHWPNGQPETVHTYGWYLRKFITDSKAKGATPIVLSMIPRNEWADGKIILADKDFGLWAKQVAQNEHVPFIDLNGITASKYNLLGADKVKNFFPVEHTHTNREGAAINAESVVDGIKLLPKLTLNNYLRK